jgi:hypothetical protein
MYINAMFMCKNFSIAFAILVFVKIKALLQIAANSCTSLHVHGRQMAPPNERAKTNMVKRSKLRRRPSVRSERVGGGGVGCSPNRVHVKNLIMDRFEETSEWAEF